MVQNASDSAANSAPAESVYDELTEPAHVEAPREHKLWPKIHAALREIYDPEIPVNIYELGLIYGLDVDPLGNHADIQMTLTAPGCPVAGEMPGWVENAVGAVEGVSGVEVSMTFDPPWTPDRMSEEARVAVGWY